MWSMCARFSISELLQRTHCLPSRDQIARRVTRQISRGCRFRGIEHLELGYVEASFANLATITQSD